MSSGPVTPEVRGTGPQEVLAVRMTGINKWFGPVRANRDASLEVRTASIHALVGENGAGKSTLMRILGGLLRPDSGKVEVEGRDVTGWTTHDAIAAGVGVVHQHFMLVPTLTVAENVVLGQEPKRGPMLDRVRAKADVADLEQRTGLAVGGDRRVSELSVGEAQRVEILKILYRGAKILVLDEPTAVLSPPEVRELWAVLRRVRDQGSTIILITHRLDEVIDLSETITVMRDGATVARLKTSGTTTTGIAQAMVGRAVALTEAVGVVNRPSGEKGAGEQTLVPALEVKNLVVRGARGTRVVDDVSFTVGAGEILGIAGVEGNGQTELIEAIAGIRPIESGEIFIGPREAMHFPVNERRRLGLAHVPEDRHGRGLILDYSVADNLILGEHGEFAGKFGMDEARIRSRAEERVREFDIRPPAPHLPARALSGGNQQKVVIAREMGKDFVVLLASQPTRGVDVGAIEFIHQRLRDARAAGKAVLLVSAELNEVLALADRVAVMYRGKFATVVPVREADPKVIGEYMIGTKQSTAA